MRTLTKLLSVLALCAVMLPVVRVVQAQAQEIPVSAGEAVAEVSSGRILFEKDGQRSLPMASTTKILTATIIIEDCDLDQTVTVPEQAAGVEGSSVYLVAGEKMTVRDLLYGLMLRSGNDCAETLALYHSGSIAAFADCMNARARSIGAVNSHFINPHGLPADGHRTTANDLATIAAYALRSEEFRKIVSTCSWSVEDGGCGYRRVWQNKNKMLYQFEGADGVKTGYTVEAGRCLVTSATRGGMQLVCVVLNSPSMYERSAALLENAFGKYSMRMLFDADSYERELPTDIAGKTCRVRCEHSFCYPMRDDENFYLREELPESICLPVESGDEVGDLKIYIGNQLIFCQKIVSIESKQKSYFDILREMIQTRAKNATCASTNISPTAALQAAGHAIA